MEDIESGKELCDNFFDSLLTREDIDSQMANLLKDLYSKGNFTKEKIFQGLKTLRDNTQNEQQS